MVRDAAVHRPAADPGGLRGVSFDFRVFPCAALFRSWNKLFSLGSLLAAAAQGWMLGSYLTGFDRSLWSLLFSLGIALTLPTAYAMLGAGWLIMKTGDGLQRKAVAWARTVLWPMGAALVGISLASPLVSHTVYERWFAMPQFIGLLPIPVACAACPSISACFPARRSSDRGTSCFHWARCSPRLRRAGCSAAISPVSIAACGRCSFRSASRSRCPRRMPCSAPAG